MATCWVWNADSRYWKICFQLRVSLSSRCMLSRITNATFVQKWTRNARAMQHASVHGEVSGKLAALSSLINRSLAHFARFIASLTRANTPTIPCVCALRTTCARLSTYYLNLLGFSKMAASTNNDHLDFRWNACSIEHSPQAHTWHCRQKVRKRCSVKSSSSALKFVFEVRRVSSEEHSVRAAPVTSQAHRCSC